MFWQLLFIALGIATLYYRWQRRKLYKIHEEIPSGIKQYPLIGHAHLLMGSDEDRMKTFQKHARIAIEQGGLSTFWMMNVLCVVCCDPTAAEVILRTCLNKEDYMMQSTSMLIRTGSVFAPAHIWRPRRKTLAPIFSLKNLNSFMDVFVKESIRTANKLEAEAGRGDFSIWNYINTYTFTAIGDATLGVNFKPQVNGQHKFVEAIDVVLNLIATRICTIWMYPDFVYKNLPCYKLFFKYRTIAYQFVDEIIKSKHDKVSDLKREGEEPSEGRMKSFLEMMMDSSGKASSKAWSDLELREEVLTIMIAGTDSSAVGISFAVVMLSRYPDVQEKVHQELEEVFGNSERLITVEDLPKVKYLDMVIKETLRLYPPVPVITRQVDKDVKLPSGATMVDGVRVLVNIWGMHRNPKYWGEDAEQFHPERFLEPLEHPAQFMPFSYSTRNCIGYKYALMSMKTMLANLLRRYRVLPPSNMDPMELKAPLKVKFNIMMKHVDNYNVRLEKKNKE